MPLAQLSMQWRDAVRGGIMAACLVLSASLPAAEPLSPSAKASAPKAPPKAEAPPKPEETLLFTTVAGKRRALGRMDVSGTCKAYLGKLGEGWVGYADPRIKGDDFQAVTSADGTRIALLSDRSGALNLWLLSSDAREWKQLTDDDGGIMPAADATGQVMAFSPDGRHLAVVRWGALWLLPMNGDEAHTMTLERGVRSLAWSADGRWIAYLSGNSVRKVELGGAPDILLASSSADEPDLIWHPDAKQELLFYFGHGLRRIDSRRRSTLLAASSSRPNDLALLPGGKQAALLVPAANGLNEVHMATLGEKATTVAQVTQGGAQGVLASTGGKYLYFLRDEQIWRCELGGQKARPLSPIKLATVRTASLPPLKGVCP